MAWTLLMVRSPISVIRMFSERSVSEATCWAWSENGQFIPSQVDIAQDAFSPSATAVSSARKQQKAYSEALKQGLGAIQVDGVMVDAASVRIQQNIIDKADLICM